jgi:hypothetical protein
MALERLVATRHPVRHVTYGYADAGSPTLSEVLAEPLGRWRAVTSAR